LQECGDENQQAEIGAALSCCTCRAAAGEVQSGKDCRVGKNSRYGFFQQRKACGAENMIQKKRSARLQRAASRD
jgi:hypothetical protein